MRIKLGKKNKKFFDLPELMNYVLFSKEEFLWFLGIENNEYRRKPCVGVGRVTFVEKGNKLDIVGINFGRSYSRRIIVVSNHARRQIYTLKKGQLAWFVGYIKIFTEEGKVKSQLFAKGFQGWYVPKTIDIKNYDLDSIEPLKDENEKDTQKFIDEILNGAE